MVYMDFITNITRSFVQMLLMLITSTILANGLLLEKIVFSHEFVQVAVEGFE